MRSWIKARKVEIVYMIKLQQEEREDTASRAGPKPSQLLQESGKEVPEDLGELLDGFQDVFQDLPPGGVENRVIKHKIPTVPGQLPYYPKQCYNLFGDHLKELKAQLKERLGKGFIVPSQSPIAAPVFFVGKKDGTWRLVIDYRALNGITIKQEYPIPRIHDLINRLGKAQWYSKLDLQAGYHQVEIAKEDGRPPFVRATVLSNFV